MEAGVVIFPGSNCDRDLIVALSMISKKIHRIWHKDTVLPSNLDIIGIPGGFSYGDYLRCGSMAGNSRIMEEIKRFANRGGLILGICNGFQILTEAGLLPGVLLKNKGLKFISKNIELETVNRNTRFTREIKNKPISMPIAHMEGNYFCDKNTLKSLEDNEQIAFKYKNNPNGSIADIAGIFNKKKNILAMMPHPERAIDKTLAGGDQGLDLFKSLVG